MEGAGEVGKAAAETVQAQRVGEQGAGGERVQAQRVGREREQAGERLPGHRLDAAVLQPFGVVAREHARAAAVGGGEGELVRILGRGDDVREAAPPHVEGADAGVGRGEADGDGGGALGQRVGEGGTAVAVGGVERGEQRVGEAGFGGDLEALGHAVGREAGGGRGAGRNAKQRKAAAGRRDEVQVPAVRPEPGLAHGPVEAVREPGDGVGAVEREQPELGLGVAGIVEALREKGDGAAIGRDLGVRGAVAAELEHRARAAAEADAEEVAL